MKKYSLAALVLAGSVGAYADGNVIVYGQMNVGLVSQDNGVVRTTRVDNMYNPSRIGFKGEEDLGGGMKAIFLLETRVNPDDAAQTSFGDREAWVGLANDLGKFSLGRGKTPYTNLADKFDIFEGSLLYPLAIYNKDGLQASRQNNSLRYDSATFSGFNTSIMYSFGENKTTTTPDNRNVSLTASYTYGPAFVALGYTQQDDQAGVSGRDNKALMLSGIYTLDALKFQFAYQNGKKENLSTTVNNQKRNTWLGEVLYTIDKTTLKAGVIYGANIKQNGKTLDDTKYTRSAIGAKYALSKRTAASIEYVADNNHKDTSGTSVANTNALTLGLSHLF